MASRRRLSRPLNRTFYFTRETYGRLAQAAEVQQRTLTKVIEMLIVDHLPPADVAVWGLTPTERRERAAKEAASSPSSSSQAPQGVAA